MGVSWLKTGADSAKAAEQAKAEAEAKKAEMGNMFRFFIKKGEDARITFVDGELSSQGFLLPPRFYEHTVMFNGNWTNFVCPEKTSPELGHKCPLCETGDYASLVALFTVVDHRTYKSPTTGKTYKDTTKLFVAKSGTYEMLNKIAIKRDGLIGCTFDVSRMGDKAPAVGSMFDFVEKNDPEKLKGVWTRSYKDKDGKEVTEDSFKVADYDKEIVFRTGDELRALGFGKGAHTGSGFAGANPGGSQQSAESKDYSNEL
ncbi:hypothetical protein DLP05_057 [Stenotrophomonas phage vB_SmaS_DLP_5]|uniref:Uncharacterized protein n=1 Tax=Stenotrophomonas phage vB_SmaS_DLP_5 TaxID=2044561 RepID=A0A2D2W2D9_9CAUD|nr:hypothetical protein FDJ07_gp056 [Stenotrophomonas phage vB_SmaS_DLP_5]ATS92312.1 hypothetical protein DLP05_057 [Stenotrophomonas phage vB_SmaS_DLP_5]